ncbi:amidohydrolase family protein [Pedobacter cryophilus]|uniref:Uncharacterized protein n=1 Tax=Pedobacter cryophilus TaxID=2571271 RepID=A0A4U1CAS3_9SPHI|nr:hypothetical protein [Pedobacter cryophilus]TKC00798.1 hypothetical protein FA046_03740 [Pedobacter cryophilus]
MAALIIESTNSKNLKLIAELAKQLGSRVKSVSDEALIDFEFEKDAKDELPDFVLKGIERGLQDVKAGRVKSFEEVKEIIAKR